MLPSQPIRLGTRCTLVAGATLLVLWYASARPQTFDRSAWTNFTTVNEIMGLKARSDTLWLATTGGLVRMVMGQEADPARLTNAEGLGDNDLRFVTVDSGGVIWTGGLNGRLCRRFADDSWRNYMFELDGSNLLLFAASSGPDGFLWVASSIGLHKFDTERHGGEIKESYTRIGDWPSSNAVHDVLVTADYVWVVGPAGVARAHVDDAFLLNPSRWQTWSEFAGMNAIEAMAGQVYVGGDDGLWSSGVLEGSDDPQWVRVGFESRAISDLSASAETLWVATDAGLGFCASNECQEAPLPGTPNAGLTSVARTSDGSIWGGQSPDGVRRFKGGLSTLMRFDGPLSNEIEDVAVGRDGKVWCVHPAHGWDYLEEGHWTPLEFSALYSSPGGPATSAVVAPNGDVWLCGWGGGATLVDPANPNGNWTHYDATNSALMWVLSDEGVSNYVVIRDVAVDPSGRVWFANAYADSGRVIVFYDHGCWGSFNRTDGFTSDDMQVLWATEGDLLVGFSNAGIVDLEYGQPLCVNSVPTGRVDGLTPKGTIDGLPADNITAILIDRSDSLWVGTNVGLARWAADIRRFLDVPLPAEAGLAINALAADLMNTIWIGTDRGLVRLPAGGDAEFFNAENSPLVGNDVREISIDERNGTVFIATSSGLSQLNAGIKPADNVADVLAFPNPFEVESTGDRRVRFNAPFGSRVFIHTVSGQFISEVDGAEGWDGRNQNGSLVASGVYLFVVRDPNGEYGRGKIALIQRR